jgi:hypothetical protein
MAKIVEIQEGVVIQVSAWNGSPFINPPGRTIIMVGNDSLVVPGWLWNGSTNTLYPVAQFSGPNKVEKIEFMRLFTMEERVRYNALRKIVASLTANDYSATDPMSQLFIALDIVFDSFDLAALVELDHPETIQGLGLLAAGGVFGSNSETQTLRITQVLQAQIPSVT